MSAILAGFLLIQAGCNIPPLRYAQQAALLPATFLRANNNVVLDANQSEPPPVLAPAPSSDDDPKEDDPKTDGKGDAKDDAKPDEGAKKSNAEEMANAGDVHGPIQHASYFAPILWSASAELDRQEEESDALDSDKKEPDSKSDDSESDKKDSDSEKKDLYSESADTNDESMNPAVITDSQDNSSCLTWHEFFNDPTLVDLVNQALAGNQELKILTEEIFIANNEIQARRGEYLPFVTFGGRSLLEKSSRFTRAGAVEEELEVAPDKAFPDPLPDFLVAANVSWEVDIWRKLRNARDAAAFRYLGTQDGQNYIVTRMVAEVAENYYGLLALDNRMKTLDQTIAIQQRSLTVARAKKEAGRGTELPIQRFLAEVRKNQSEKLVIQQEIIEAENRINFLLGRYPQTVARAPVEFLDLTLPTLKLGVPAQLLQNRPDIRQAERELAAAGLDIKVAKARFYPSLDITGGLGYQAFNPKYLFKTPEALIYNIAGDLVAPLINKQAIKAAYKTANAKQLQAVYHYQQTVLDAYTEVINRMSKVENYGKSIAVKKQQLKALETSVEVASQLFQNARAEYVEVLLAQREMMEARMMLIEIKQEQLAAVINTYQALGGGKTPVFMDFCSKDDFPQ